jgi:hypothetical protein
MTASTPKVYVPMTLAEAEAFVPEKMITVFGSNEEATVIYAEILRVHQRIDEIENQAAEMMSPDAMMDMATKFLGGGLTP